MLDAVFRLLFGERPRRSLPPLLGVACSALVGCEHSPPRPMTASQPQAASPSEPARSERDVPSAAPDQPKASAQTGSSTDHDLTAKPGQHAPPSPPDAKPQAEASQEPAPAPVPPQKLPPYISVLERVEHEKRSVVDSAIVRNKLQLSTQNVKRLRISRRDLPIARDKSVILRVDDFVLEWTPKSDTIELELGRNAGWQIVEPPPARP